MIDLAFCKKWMKIDDDVDDDVITMLYDAAVEYIQSAVGNNVDTNSAKYRVVVLAIMTTMYEAREFTSDKTSEKTLYTINGIMRQLWIDGMEDLDNE